jgi:hypothetical protein
MTMPSRIASTLLLSVALIGSTWAASLADISNAEASSGLHAALEKGAETAVGKLGVENGFLNNDKVKINLPSSLDKAQRLLRMTGQGPKLDELVVTMNHAAEQAVPLAKPLLTDAIKSMTVTDAKQILTGGETSVTDFFRQKTSIKLKEQFKPTVKSVTDRVGLAESYNRIMGPIAEHGAVPPQEATVEAYVTDRAVDGLFLMIGEEEKAIRQDPVGTGSKAIEKVFGLLK